MRVNQNEGKRRNGKGMGSCMPKLKKNISRFFARTLFKAVQFISTARYALGQFFHNKKPFTN